MASTFFFYDFTVAVGLRHIMRMLCCRINNRWSCGIKTYFTRYRWSHLHKHPWWYFEPKVRDNKYMASPLPHKNENDDKFSSFLLFVRYQTSHPNFAENILYQHFLEFNICGRNLKWSRSHKMFGNQHEMFIKKNLSLIKRKKKYFLILNTSYIFIRLKNNLHVMQGVPDKLCVFRSL